ncbi:MULTISPECIES: hypothetical protein [Streptomyces]|uniref:hypothetical protein n=1 Tax=Streptomyces TaxID=1883 RepID=UPI00117CD72D|nr:hypothetical protein [Streptomyces kasugaensis]
MRRIILPVLFLAAAVVLTGCGAGGDPESTPTGPPVITATPLPAAKELADRYREAGGAADVYGIRSAKDREGVLVLTVWTHQKTYYKNFDDVATGMASFLTREGGRLHQGYLLNLYGSDGTRLHSYDTTPVHTP